MPQIPGKQQDGQLVVVPGFAQATLTPTSPVAFDQIGARISNLCLETQGQAAVELWGSANAPDSATPVSDPAISWLYLGEVALREAGLHCLLDLAPQMVAEMSRHRYAKLDPIRGKVNKVHIYAA